MATLAFKRNEGHLEGDADGHKAGIIAGGKAVCGGVAVVVKFCGLRISDLALSY